MVVYHWTHEQKNIVFDPIKGTAKVVLLDIPNKDKLQGYGANENRVFGKRVEFVIVIEKGNLNFYAGNKKWNLEQGNIKFKHERNIPFLSKFQIFNNSQCEFSITYSHIGRLLYSFIDPTYDKLEQDSDFFLEFITENALCESWQKHVKKEWCK
jgi:hypothetical protein